MPAANQGAATRAHPSRPTHSWGLPHPHQLPAPCYLPQSPRHHTLAAAFLWSCYEPGVVPTAHGQHSLHRAWPTFLCRAASSWTLLSQPCFSRGFQARGGDKGPGQRRPWHGAGHCISGLVGSPGRRRRLQLKFSQALPGARGVAGESGHSPTVRFCLMPAAQGGCMDPQQQVGWAVTEC